MHHPVYFSSLRNLASRTSSLSIRLRGRPIPHPTWKRHRQPQGSNRRGVQIFAKIWVSAALFPGPITILYLTLIPFTTVALLGNEEGDIKSLQDSGLLWALFDLPSLAVAQQRTERTSSSTLKITTPMYSRLPRDNIRLLLLEPGHGDDPLSYRLIHDDLSKPLRYEALSYAWGDPTPVQPSVCNGVEKMVSCNLSTALHYLRLPSRARLLWVDALCIDQADRDEKKQQIRNMPRIYSNASRVIVWLGEPSIETERCFASIKRSNSSRADKDWLVQSQGYAFFPARGTGVDNEAQALLLNECLERSWFSRAWVLQEVVYGRRVTIRCGHLFIEWNPFARAVDASLRNGSIVELLSDGAQESAKNVVQMSRTKSLTRSERSLLSVLLATNSTHCSDPRDKVYAILSLANEAMPFSEFQADYGLTAAEVYETCASLLIESMGMVDVLCCSTDLNQIGRLGEKQLPSWVPDWTRIENGQLFVSHQGIPFNCGGKRRLTSIRLEGKALSFQATRVDTIHTVAGPSKFTKTPVFTRSAHSHSWIGLKQTAQWIKLCANATEMASPSNLNSFWRTMLCDLTGDGHRAPPIFAVHFSRYQKFLEDASHLVHQLLSGGIHQHLFDRQMYNLMSKYRTDIAQVESSLYAWSSKRQFAVTKEARLAFVPNTSAPGDAIFVVDGLPVPLILRPIENGYRSIGEAYVHGIMYGEDQQNSKGHSCEVVKAM